MFPIHLHVSIFCSEYVTTSSHWKISNSFLVPFYLAIPLDLEMWGKLIFWIQVIVKFSLSITDRKTFRCVFLLLILVLNTCTWYIHTHNELYEAYFLKDAFLVSCFSRLIWHSKLMLAATKTAFLLFVWIFLFVLNKGEREGSWMVLKMLYWKDWRKTPTVLSFVT